MVSSKSSAALVQELKAVVESHRPSPEVLRYAFKQVRVLTGIKRPVRPRRLPKFYTPAELYRMFEAANTLGPDRRVFIDVLVQTGLRIAEFHALDLRDIEQDVEGARIHIRRGKGGKERYLPISGRLYHELKLYAQGRTAGPLFEQQGGKSMTVRTFQRWYDEIIRAAGVDKKGGPHTARHTYAVICRSNGIPLQDLQIRMGHEKLETTQIYAQIADSPEQRRAYLQIFESGRYLSGGEK
jgi:integrase/recombinase XerD